MLHLRLLMTCEDTCNNSTILIHGDTRQEEKTWMEKLKKKKRNILELTWNNCRILVAFSHNILLFSTILQQQNLFRFVSIFFFGTSKYNTTSAEMKRRNQISKAFPLNCSILRTKNRVFEKYFVLRFMKVKHSEG